MRGYGKEGVVDAIRREGGEIYAITSEPHSLAINAQEHWSTGIIHVGDPHQEILAECQERGWLSLFTNDWKDDFITEPWVAHPKGYFQPGVIALQREGRVLYRWRSRPSRKNAGGAMVRPTATYVWTSVQRALAEPKDSADAILDNEPTMDTQPIPWPLFVLLLISNGWFLRPVPFDERVGERSVPRRVRNAAIRIPLFLAAWLVAYAALPAWIVTLVLALWLAKITPGVLMVHKRFQNVGAEDQPNPAGP